MPVLWNPTVQTDMTTSPPTYTLGLVTTQQLDMGVVLEFQTYDGLAYAYADALLAGAVFSFRVELTVSLPPNTFVAAVMTTTSTGLYAYNGTAAYSTQDAGLDPAAFQEFATVLAFAYGKSPFGALVPTTGVPQFAMGFDYADAVTAYPTCALVPVPAAALTAPNFPDQYSGAATYWTFQFEVVFPCFVTNGSGGCAHVEAIKYRAATEDAPCYVPATWLSLREVVAQPMTLLTDTAESVTNWEVYPAGDPTAVGPFTLVAAPGQLAVVYFKPWPLSGNSYNTPDPGAGTAEIAFLVTAPLPAQTVLYFTNLGYDAQNLGYGSRNGGAFVTTAPAFQWTTGSLPIPAGTVVLFTGIGTSTILLSNAQDSSADVGAVTNNLTSGQAIPALIVTGAWQLGVPQLFVTAALSAQYSGDYPVGLTPGLTISSTPFTSTAVYGFQQVFNNVGLPGTVQAAMINSGAFAVLPTGTVVGSGDLPAFLNMACYRIPA